MSVTFITVGLRFSLAFIFQKCTVFESIDAWSLHSYMTTKGVCDLLRIVYLQDLHDLVALVSAVRLVLLHTKLE